MYRQWDNLNDSDQTASVDRQSPDRSVPDLEDRKDISDSRWDSFLDIETADQEPSYDKFAFRQLTILLDWKS